MSSAARASTGADPLDHIGEPPGEVDHRRFGRQHRRDRSSVRVASDTTTSNVGEMPRNCDRRMASSGR
jgi:hypothetical protein